MAQNNQSNAQAWGQASAAISKTIQQTLEGVEKEVTQRTYRASNEMRNSALFVLRGNRTGRMYRVPHTKQMYRASAPGEPPAVRTGAFRLSWGTRVHVTHNGSKFEATASIESFEQAGGQSLGEMLENGHGHTAARPYKQRVIDRALPKVRAIYEKPYHG